MNKYSLSQNIVYILYMAVFSQALRYSIEQEKLNMLHDKKLFAT